MPFKPRVVWSMDVAIGACVEWILDLIFFPCHLNQFSTGNFVFFYFTFSLKCLQYSPIFFAFSRIRKMDFRGSYLLCSLPYILVLDLISECNDSDTRVSFSWNLLLLFDLTHWACCDCPIERTPDLSNWVCFSAYEILRSCVSSVFAVFLNVSVVPVLVHSIEREVLRYWETAEKDPKYKYIFDKKCQYTYSYASIRTPNYRKSRQPSKKNIQQFKTWKKILFSFLWFIFALLDPDSYVYWMRIWIRIQQLKLMRIHADPDPQPCFS
jgi:hypothetical protein